MQGCWWLVIRKESVVSSIQGRDKQILLEFDKYLRIYDSAFPQKTNRTSEEQISRRASSRYLFFFFFFFHTTFHSSSIVMGRTSSAGWRSWLSTASYNLYLDAICVYTRLCSVIKRYHNGCLSFEIDAPFFLLVMRLWSSSIRQNLRKENLFPARIELASTYVRWHHCIYRAIPFGDEGRHIKHGFGSPF